MANPRPPHWRERVATDPTTGCLLWLGHLNPAGYARLGARMAHRAIYEMEVGPIPAGLQLDHLCRVRSCVNPEHMEPVTAAENLKRGATVPALNAAKTHCPQGHPYECEHLYVDPKGYRQCRTCRRSRNQQARRSEVAA